MSHGNLHVITVNTLTPLFSSQSFILRSAVCSPLSVRYGAIEITLVFMIVIIIVIVVIIIIIIKVVFFLFLFFVNLKQNEAQSARAESTNKGVN